MIKLFWFQNIQYINKIHCLLNLREFTLTYSQQNDNKQTESNHKKGAVQNIKVHVFPKKEVSHSSSG